MKTDYKKKLEALDFYSSEELSNEALKRIYQLVLKEKIRIQKEKVRQAQQVLDGYTSEFMETALSRE